MTETVKKDNFELTRLPKKAFEILVALPWKEVEESRKEVISQASKTVEIKGFRKGMAPEKMVEQYLGTQRLLELTLQKIIPDYYQKVVEEFSLNPIITPKIQLVSTEEGKDWQVKFISCEHPEVNLGNYKEELRKIKPKEEIWTPGKEEKKEEKKENRDEKINESISWLIDNIKVEICDLLIEEEVGRRLSDLLDQTQKLGIAVDQYLSSVGKTIEQLREEYAKRAADNLALEFILEKIADQEKIEVGPEELDKILSAAKNEEEKKALEDQKYVLATMIRRQKTLDFLGSL
ncbi:hypothetical protein C4578_03845 [Candidatus Microgenomates bacterium]|jgi:trigger factor|nr:MAG: hypothetical protein C4578_03845 [Candidatus Microgenomates bacterium]